MYHMTIARDLEIKQIHLKQILLRLIFINMSLLWNLLSLRRSLSSQKTIWNATFARSYRILNALVFFCIS